MRDSVIALCAVMVLAGTACQQGIRGSGKLKKEQRVVKAFNEMDLSGAYRLYLTAGQGDAKKVNLELSGDDNLLPLLRTETLDRRLVVAPKRRISSTRPMTIRGRIADLRRLEVSGSCRAEITGLKNKHFRLKASGSVRAALAGETKRLSIGISGSGRVKARKLAADEVAIDISGSGRIEVCARKKLKVDISGSGTVTYYCNPAKIKQSISGSGKLIRK